MKKITHLLFVIGLVYSNTSISMEFDKSLIAGVWSESINTSQACNSENLHTTFELTNEGKNLVFKLDRAWEIATGKSVTEYTAKVLSSTSNSMTIEYENLSGLPDNYPETWEISFVAPGVYRWRASSWPAGKVNSVVGIRCSQ